MQGYSDSIDKSRRKYEIDYDAVLAAIPELNRQLRKIAKERFTRFAEEIERNRSILEKGVVSSSSR